MRSSASRPEKIEADPLAVEEKESASTTRPGTDLRRLQIRGRWLEEFDQCRWEVAEILAGKFDHLALDVVFTRDPHWVAASIGSVELSGNAVQEEAETAASSVGTKTDDPSGDDK
jgi:hypothetical protein